MCALPQIRTLEAPILTPQHGVDWADTMVLNPAIIDQPGSSRLHMLFRATGPWPRARLTGKPLPYPIFLGYARSDDNGVTWQADFSQPALAPRLAHKVADLYIATAQDKCVVNYANGCIEDPRLVRLDGQLFLTTACRLFPPGAYWCRDDPMQCAPAWARSKDQPLGRAAAENLTVTTLWKVNLSRLARRDYPRSFSYVTHLTDPERGDNRDVMLFPRKLVIEGRARYVCLHRPQWPVEYGETFSGLRPSMFVSVADRLEDFGTARAQHRLLARSVFEWESDRIGASWGPLDLGDGEWFLPYHGKDAVVGYTQSFMILAESADGWPVVRHRCPDRLMFAQKRWETDGLFKTPCVFTCGGLVRGGELIMTYGAADSNAGAAWVDFAQLLAHVRRYDAQGEK